MTGPDPTPAATPRVPAVPPVHTLSRADDRFFDELTRTNNELANLQRELARKHAELTVAQRKLQASELRYRSLSACSPLGVLEMDSAGRCLYANPHWSAITGLSADESLGDGWQRALDPRDAPDFLAEWHAARNAGVDFRREFRSVTVRGDPRWAQARARAIPAESGAIAGFVVTVEDITDRKQAEADLAEAQKELVTVSRQAGMAEVATGVLHNVGNVLNSVNVSATLVTEQVRDAKAANLTKIGAMLQERTADLAGFLTDDPKGRKIPAYLITLAAQVEAERAVTTAELGVLRQHLEHIRDAVALQQNYARVQGLAEKVVLSDLVEEALRINAAAQTSAGLGVVRDFGPVPPVTCERHKVLQILVNLLQNAGRACAESPRSDRQVTVRIAGNAGAVQVSVSDNGTGIAPENLTRIFAHGFTTRKDGHGFGLHTGALAAKALGGTLSAHSDGPGQGATFILELPLATPQ